MSRNYPIRPYSGLNSDDFAASEADAESTIGATSSPPGPSVPDIFMPENVPFLALGSDAFGDEDLDLDYGSNFRAPKSNNTDKTLAVLKFIKDTFPRFSLRDLIQELFTSDNGSIKNVTNSYLGTGGNIHLLEVAIRDRVTKDSEVDNWIMDKAISICGREVSFLTNQASNGKHFDDARSLRLPANAVKVELLQTFSVPDLLVVYEQTTVQLQKFLKAVIGKDAPPVGADESMIRCQRNPDMGRTMITSMILNLRSRETNLHCAMNSLMLWDGRVPKRLVQTLNRYGFSTSYLYQTKAVRSVSKDGVYIASAAANDPEKILALPYDNFNWSETAWETSAQHGNISHDQVSALLLALRLPEGSSRGEAGRLAGVENFAQTAQKRHTIPPDQALEQILPTATDQHIFADNAMKHMRFMGSKHTGICYPRFSDPYALPLEKDEEYFLPTYDQEQASNRGNMLVIEHYFLDILRVPKEVFEKRYYFLLGDRLTTARDRAAQDQRAVDRSEHRVDHLASFQVLSGIMHFVMNKIQNVGKNAWGGANKDAVSLVTLLEKLPNRNNINLRKIDFYAWLRFLDVVLRALVLRAAIVELGLSSPTQLQKCNIPAQHFKTLCSRIVQRFLLPSVDRLEAEDIKTIPGSTESGNAVLLMHDLMTIREMRHAVKHGHPERMERMIKYWTPMFYAGGSFNYANEGMELLHNLNHDWPADTAIILRGGMLMNNQGKAATFKETDIRVEQFNKTIKSHAHGANARPGLLEKITPAIGHIQELTEQIFEDLGVEDENQHHTKISQHKDVALLLDHFCSSKIFDFTQDKRTDHMMIDLYRTGLHRLAGPNGGHARHLRRHILRSRTRHFNEMPPEDSNTFEGEQRAIHNDFVLSDDDFAELEDLNRELALDNERPKLSLLEQLDEVMRWGVDYSDDTVPLYD
ncbi:hypothetical protein C8R43DRAFT_1102631 [Mycena crocata]|nr:hypothetical protein C8R43DRAFT_1102631 [Mycena crocata]